MKIDMNKVDLTNGTQKFIALVLLGLVLFGLYFLLPPLVVIFTNLVYLIGLVLIVAFFAFNAHNIFNLFKQISFYATKKMISSNPIWYMYNYHTFILSKIAELEKSIVNITTIKNKLQSKIGELNDNINLNSQQVKKFREKGASESQIRVLANKVNLDKKQLDVLLPRFVTVEKQETYLNQLAEHWIADAEDLKNTLDAKADEYKMLKELSIATGTASEFLKGNSEESKDYQLSLQQIEESCNRYAANVQIFEKKARPILENLSLNREISADAGLQLIEEFKQKHVKLSLPPAEE